MTMRRVMTVVLVGALPLLLAGCIQISGTVPPGGAVVPTETPTGTVRPVTRGVVHEKLSAGPWTVTVEDAKRTGDSVGGATPKTGNELLVVEVGFENSGTDSLVVDPADFTLEGSSGSTFKLAKTDMPAYNAQSMRPLMGRFGTSTVFVFEVPKGSERFDFGFTPPGTDDTTLRWRVP